MRRAGQKLHGVAGAPGIAIAPIWRYRPPQSTRSASQAVTTDGAIAQLHTACEGAAEQLHELAKRVQGLGRSEEAEIFEAQSLIALDSALLDEAERRIIEEIGRAHV
jgi:phosphoenolpyruvate-protein kinase (PTS system EI component)